MENLVEDRWKNSYLQRMDIFIKGKKKFVATVEGCEEDKTV